MISSSRASLLLLSLFCTGLASRADARQAVDLDYYLPDDVQYDPAFPKPADVLGWEVGSWHARHDQIVRWFETVAEASPRVRLETYARTYEERPLLLATISSPANLARIDDIRRAHVGAVRSGAEREDGPAVVWMGYSVHGNESSGSNASLLLAYHLAAAQGDAVERFLENTVVLIDPCLNPDGLSRFAQWANSHRGKNLVGDPRHKEHVEAWPGGRTNHYWFDLNRDWLLLTHPESRGRLERFHDWLPCVLTDYHEMGSDATYFFQPGIPSRQNPLTPERNLDLTRAIAGYHADALDEIGSLYYTEESFDDFYYGKGSTYPDLNGSIGILFEQASSRGHLQENSFGGISFPFTIKNQFTTSLSTLSAVDDLRGNLMEYQREFYREARAEAARHDVRAYVFGAAEDPGRTFRLVDLLRRHDIVVHRLAREVAGARAGETFRPESAYLVPLEQPQFRLIRALFETRTSWPDNTFYDVSSWMMPASFDVPVRELRAPEFTADLVGEDCTGMAAPTGSMPVAEDAVAWLFEWHHYDAPRALQHLLAAGVRARVATRRFEATTDSGRRAFDYGTIVVPTGVQDIERAELREKMAGVAALGLDVHAATSGLTPGGVDLGSRSLLAVEAPAPLLVVGSGVSSYEAGEVWHYLDQRLDVPVSMADKDSFGRLELERYTHVLLVGGGNLPSERVDDLRDWIRAGGVLVATKGAATWAAETFMTKGEAAKDAKPGGAMNEDAEQDEAKSDGDDASVDGDAGIDEPERTPTYEDYEQERAVQSIAGTIFRARLDRTHPLLFGYVRDQLTVFRNSERILPEGDDPFGTPLRYTDDPLVSGFASPENVERIAGSPAARAQRVGRGTVIALIDDPNFRGVWYGTNKLYANALFFGAAIKSTGKIDPSSASDSEVDSHGHGH